MATIDIGGRTLKVRPHTLGLVRKVLLPIEARQEKATTKDADGKVIAVDRTETMACEVEFFFAFVGEINPDVTRAWLEDVLPARSGPLVLELLTAAGAAATEAQKAPGEAKAP